MPIICRYIARDIVAAMAAVAVVLLLIILGKLFIQLLSEVLDGDVGADMLGSVLLLGVIRYLVVLLPFALFMAIVLVLTRMYKDSEINAAMAAGASNRELIKAVMLVAAPMMVALYLLVAYVSPWAQRLAEVIESVTEQSLMLGQLAPGRFFELENTGWVIYAESRSPQQGVLENVFLQRTQGETVIAEIAQTAKMIEHENARVFVMFNGKTIEGIPGRADYAVSTYDEHRIYLPRADFSRQAGKAKYQNINALLSLQNADYTAEFLQRASIIGSTLLLTLLAVPLSNIRSHGGRFARIAAAALIYILYLNLVIVVCSWIKREQSHAVAMLAGVHLLVMICVYLAYHQFWLPAVKRYCFPAGVK